MGTRGLLGFTKNGIDKVAYNNWDSYPSELGIRILNFVRNKTIEQLNEDFDKLQLIDTNVPPTKEQIQKCRDAGTIDLNVSERSEQDWYCLLRRLQGDLEGYVSLGLMPDCNLYYYAWKYIINLDSNTLDISNGSGEIVVQFDLNNISMISNKNFIDSCNSSCNESCDDKF